MTLNHIFFCSLQYSQGLKGIYGQMKPVFILSQVYRRWSGGNLMHVLGMSSVGEGETPGSTVRFYLILSRDKINST